MSLLRKSGGHLTPKRSNKIDFLVKGEECLLQACNLQWVLTSMHGNIIHTLLMGRWLSGIGKLKEQIKSNLQRQWWSEPSLTYSLTGHVLTSGACYNALVAVKYISTHIFLTKSMFFITWTRGCYHFSCFIFIRIVSFCHT